MQVHASQVGCGINVSQDATKGAVGEWAATQLTKRSTLCKSISRGHAESAKNLNLVPQTRCAWDGGFRTQPLIIFGQKAFQTRVAPLGGGATPESRHVQPMLFVSCLYSGQCFIQTPRLREGGNEGR
jgi:hypothetical protein